MKDTKKKHDSHFVSHDKSLDLTHVALETGHDDPLVDTQDGEGVVSDCNSQQAAAGSDPRKIGGEDERSVKPNQKVTLGRHVKSDNGFEKAKSRRVHVKSARAENQSAFTTKK